MPPRFRGENPVYRFKHGFLRYTNRDAAPDGQRFFFPLPADGVYEFCVRRFQQETFRLVSREQSNLSDTYISHMERATKQVSLNALLRLAAALEVTLDQLLSGSQPQDTGAYLPELQTLFQDCSLREQRILLDIAGAVKEVLRANHWAA